MVQAQQFGLDDVGGALAQRGHGRGDLGHPLSGQVGGDFGGDEVAGGFGVGRCGPGRRLALHAVHVDHPDAGQPGYRRVDVARHAQVADHQRCVVAAAGGQRVVNVGQRHHRADGAGAADHDVGVGQRGGQLVQAQSHGRRA